MEKIGIIDAGGGLRGIYAAGVMDYLIKNNIEVDYGLGVSAGSANIVSYIAKQYGRNKEFYLDYSFEKDYMSLSNYVKNGSYINLDYIYGTLSNEGGRNPLDYDSVMNSRTELVVVATDAKTGMPHYFYKDEFTRNDYGMFKASCCVPIVNKPYEWRGGSYVDGGISNPIPIDKAFADGCTKVILVITRPKNFRREYSKKNKVYDLWKHKYPDLNESMWNRNRIYNEEMDRACELEKQGKVLIIAPDNIEGMTTLKKDKEAMLKLYKKGYRDARKIKEFLKEKDNKFNIELATIKDKEVVENLMQLYTCELTNYEDETTSFYMDKYGKYNFSRYLDSFFNDENGHPYILKNNDEIAGFCLEMYDNKDLANEIKEFYILPKFRRCDAGTFFANEVIKKYKGNWQISVLKRNEAAQNFWRKIVKEQDKEYREKITDRVWLKFNN